MRLTIHLAILVSIAAGVAFAPAPGAASSLPNPNGFSTVQDDPTPTPTPTPALTPTPVPDPELERAQREGLIAAERQKVADAEKAEAEAKKAKAEARKTEAEAARDAAKARLGLGETTPTTTAPTGTVSGGEAKFIETQILAETAVRVATGKLIATMCNSRHAAKFKTPINTVVINNGLATTGVENYRALLQQLQDLHHDYESLIKNARDAQNIVVPDLSPGPQPSFAIPPALVVPFITQTVKSVADLTSLFRSDTEFKSQDVTTDVQTLVTVLGNMLLERQEGKCAVANNYHPSLLPPMLKAGAKSPLTDAFDTLLKDQTTGDKVAADSNKAVADLENGLKDLDAKLEEQKKLVGAKNAEVKELEGRLKQAKKPSVKAQLQQQIEAARQEIADAQALSSRINDVKNKIGLKVQRLKDTVADLQAFKAGVAEINKTLTSVDAESKQTVLVGLLRAERLSGILGEANAYVIDLNVSATGTNRVRRNAFFNPNIKHTGGANVGIRVFDSDDRYVYGASEPFYIDYTDSKRIRRALGFATLEEISR